MSSKTKALGSLCLLVSATVISISASSKAAEHIVNIVSDYENLRMVFEPKKLKIKPGDTVTWINEANEEHNVVSYPDGYPRGGHPLQSHTLTHSGERFSQQFNVPGTYEYHCIPHLPMGMHGVVIVGRPSDSDEFNKPSLKEMNTYRNLIQEWFDEEDIETLEREERANAAEVDVANAICRASRPWKPIRIRH